MPQTKLVKKDKTKDLLLMFSERKKVTFIAKDKSQKALEGQWCFTCLYVANIRHNVRELTSEIGRTRN